MREILLHYQRIKTFILTGIEKGGWETGARLPSENELAKRFSVSRMTVNRAIKELEADGVVERMQGKGTFVAAPRPLTSVLQIKGIDEEVVARGNTYQSRVEQLESVTATQNLSDQLQLPVGTELGMSSVLHFENAKPIQLEQRWVNLEFWPDYLAQDFETVTPHAYLMERCPFTRGEHVIEALLAADRIREVLEMESDEAVLLIHRRTWVGDRVASYAKLFHPGSRFQITTQLTR